MDLWDALRVLVVLLGGGVLTAALRFLNQHGG